VTAAGGETAVGAEAAAGVEAAAEVEAAAGVGTAAGFGTAAVDGPMEPCVYWNESSLKSGATSMLVARRSSGVTNICGCCVILSRNRNPASIPHRYLGVPEMEWQLYQLKLNKCTEGACTVIKIP
jgi:hypothetical protein